MKMQTKDISNFQVIVACRIAHQNIFGNYNSLDILMELTHAPEKVCFAAMERCMSKKYIECGVSVRTSFVTAAGIGYYNNILNEVKSNVKVFINGVEVGLYPFLDIRSGIVVYPDEVSEFTPAMHNWLIHRSRSFFKKNNK